jgi:disulfide bond formation protein DsbB
MTLSASSAQRHSTLLLAGTAAGSLAAVGAALFGQHVQGMQPCPWCILQRLIFLTIAATALLTLAARLRWSEALRVGAALIGLLGLCGMAAALYQNLVAVHLPSCDMTLADRIVSGLGVDALAPELFEVRASCADAAVKLLGVPYELWSCLLFAVITAAAVLLLRTRR